MVSRGSVPGRKGRRRITKPNQPRAKERRKEGQASLTLAGGRLADIPGKRRKANQGTRGGVKNVSRNSPKK